MTTELRPEDFQLLQQISMELREIQTKANHARQKYIAERVPDNLDSWIVSLRAERQAWERYWKAHSEYFPQLGG